MAGKLKVNYVCTECGMTSVRPYGKCPGCGSWNTMLEEVEQSAADSYPSSSSTLRQKITAKPKKASKISEIDVSGDIRFTTGLGELDRVLGGGLVKGSVNLLCGDPGIGKSTILLQICQYMGKSGNILYVSGEESASQIKLRANRLNINTDNLYILSETDVDTVIATAEEYLPDMLIIDSVQTMQVANVNSYPGSVTQVRESALAFTRLAKERDISVFLVGHVNKEGSIAGPKVLEHTVDCVMYFEGERNLSYRILRAVKNRFGSTNEIGVFEMDGNGLSEVPNPSKMMLSGRPKGISGTSVTCTLEGTRNILAEVQALVAASGFGTPRRMSTGFDYNRMAMIIAVLEKRGGFFFGNLDVYINVVGGLRLLETAADLSIAAALYSGLKDIPIDENTFIFGEIGLAGEIRSVNNTVGRITEAARLGFTKCILPKHSLNDAKATADRLGIELIGVRSIRDLCNALK